MRSTRQVHHRRDTTIYVVSLSTKNYDSRSSFTKENCAVANSNEVWGKRLKEARTAAGLSQKQLGIEAGLDPFVASTRINRYEVGVHKADYQITQKLALILGVPSGYFYTEDDALAEIMVRYHRLPAKGRNAIVKMVRQLAKDTNTGTDNA